MSILEQFYAAFFGAHIILAPQYMVAWVLIAWAIYLSRRETVGFLRWLFPKAIWGHRSTRADLVLFTIGGLLSFFGVFARLLAVPAIATAVATAMPAAPLSGLGLQPIAIALVLWIAADFTTYWTHRCFHTIAIIWPLHAVHHSAAVLTPLTAYRQHPVSALIITSVHTVVVGTIFGLLIGALDPDTPMMTVIGTNAFIVFANITVANFHHSHIWLSFGPFFERIFVSPAQHQIHHSTDSAHFNKNFGHFLAIWDWMFGTLYVTGKDEKITFGLDGPAEAPLMTQRLGPILWQPLRRILMPHTRGQ